MAVGLGRLTPLVVLLGWGTLPLAAQIELPLETAAARDPATFRPVHEGARLVVRGQVAARPIRVASEYSHIPLQDGGGHGLIVEAPEFMFEKVSPGDRLEVRGVLGVRGGMPVLRPEGLRTEAQGKAPSPVWAGPGDLNRLHYVGLNVVTEGRVVALGENAQGEYLLLGEVREPVPVFLPATARGTGAGLGRFAVGDKVRITGLVSQDAAAEPFDGNVRLVIRGVDAVTLTEREWLIAPQSLVTAALTLLVTAGLWRRRERRVAAQRRAIRALNALSEEVIGAGSARDILKKLQGVLPDALHYTGVALYLYQRGTETLERVSEASDQEGVSFGLDATEPSQAAVALCLKNRTLVTIPDTQSSEFFPRDEAPLRDRRPRSLLLAPMLAQGEALGVLEVRDDARVRNLAEDEQAAVQHVANQAATALKLLEQEQVREQLYRSEKVAAAGQLISGIAGELRGPLDSIHLLSRQLLTEPEEGVAPERVARAVARESQRAAEALDRLMSFSRAGQSETTAIEVNALMSRLIESLAAEWQAKGVAFKNLLSPAPLHVLGARGQLEQVFLSLLVHAGEALEDAPEKQLAVGASQLAKRVLVEITYRANTDGLAPDAFEGAGETGDVLGLGVCRGIVQGHGGELRLVRASDTALRFEVELPASERGAGAARRAQSGPRRSGRAFTALVVEPDMGVRRRLVKELSARGHRVVPVANGEEAAEMAQRVRFDLLFCSVRLPGVNWVELMERSRPQVGAFVLMSEAFDSDLARLFPGGEGMLLRKPVDEADLDRILELAAGEVTGGR